MSFKGFGNTKQWKHFEKTHKMFIDNNEHLETTIAKIFSRTIPKGSTDADKVIFQLGFLCASEYREILLLVANGYGIAAQKLLRSFYEKAVTIDYIFAHPDEAKSFLEYHWIHSKKYIHQIENPENSEVIERIALVEENYEKVKENFMTTDCEKCGTKKPLHSWNKKDLRTQLINFLKRKYDLSDE
jgi:hypothetical protein